ncbi:MAG: hypothetical protein GX037_01920, partial [Trueperella sp.]|nr:hypothetical protein [Trueperella sp.]
PIVHRATGPKSQLVCPVDEAIEQVAKHHETEIALIAIESALNKKLVDIGWVSAMLERLSQRRRMALEDFSFASESGAKHGWLIQCGREVSRSINRYLCFRTATIE